MLDLKINIAFVIGDIFLYLFGIIVWTQGLGFEGFSRFFTGLFSIITGIIVSILILKFS